MSYTATISGHHVAETEEAAKQMEDAVKAKVDAFVKSLDGVTSAIFQGQHGGTHNLMPPRNSDTAQTTPPAPTA